VSTSTNNGNTVGATSTLVDTTQGTYSSISMGSYASLNDAVSGDFTIKVGTSAAQTINVTAGSTVQDMINQINGTTTTGGVTSSTYPSGVTATWVAPTTGQNFGSIELTSNTAGTSGNITAASETITDTPTAANLSYTANSAYSMGLSGTVTDSTTKQTAPATVSSDTEASSGTATISYTDAAGESLSATDLSNQTDAESALTSLNAAITDVAAQDGYIGAQINTLNAVSQVLGTQQENVQSAQNAVQATDYASATSNMSKYEILSQTGIAALAQANSMQQEVTKLLQ
jgi:flagellin